MQGAQFSFLAGLDQQARGAGVGLGGRQQVDGLGRSAVGGFGLGIGQGEGCGVVGAGLDVLGAGQFQPLARAGDARGALAAQFEGLAEREGGLGGVEAFERTLAGEILHPERELGVAPGAGLEEAAFGRVDPGAAFEPGGGVR